MQPPAGRPEDSGMTAATATPRRPSDRGSSRAEGLPVPELERRLEAHLLIARRVRR
jgi:hypothetical protein